MRSVAPFLLLLVVNSAACRRDELRDYDEIDFSDEPEIGVAPSLEMECLRTSVDVRVRMDFGEQGCFGGSEDLVDLRLEGRAASLHALEWVGIFEHRVTGPGPVFGGDAERWVRGLAEILLASKEPTEPLSRCHSSVKTFARITCWCDGRKHGPLGFETHECDPRTIPSDWQQYPPARTHRLYRWGRSVLAAFPHSPVRGDPPAEVERIKRKWGSLYEDGRRVRHDPIEEDAE